MPSNSGQKLFPLFDFINRQNAEFQCMLEWLRKFGYLHRLISPVNFATVRERTAVIWGLLVMQTGFDAAISLKGIIFRWRDDVIAGLDAYQKPVDLPHVGSDSRSAILRVLLFIQASQRFFVRYLGEVRTTYPTNRRISAGHEMFGVLAFLSANAPDVGCFLCLSVIGRWCPVDAPVGQVANTSN